MISPYGALLYCVSLQTKHQSGSKQRGGPRCVLRLVAFLQMWKKHTRIVVPGYKKIILNFECSLCNRCKTWLRKSPAPTWRRRLDTLCDWLLMKLVHHSFLEGISLKNLFRINNASKGLKWPGQFDNGTDRSRDNHRLFETVCSISRERGWCSFVHHGRRLITPFPL